MNETYISPSKYDYHIVPKYPSSLQQILASAHEAYVKNRELRRNAELMLDQYATKYELLKNKYEILANIRDALATEVEARTESINKKFLHLLALLRNYKEYEVTSLLTDLHIKIMDELSEKYLSIINSMSSEDIERSMDTLYKGTDLLRRLKG